MSKGTEAAKILSDIIVKNGGCGPFGYERPKVEDNKIYLTSQTATEIYEIKEDGKVDLIKTDEILDSWQADFGMTEEEINLFIEEEATNIDIIDMVEGKTNLTWFDYLENIDSEINKLKELFKN